MVCNLFIVSMNKYVVFAESLKDLPADAVHYDAIIDGVVNALLDADVPVTNSVVTNQDKIKIDHETVRPMNSFLQKAKVALGDLDESNAGIAFAVEFVSRLQKFANDTHAESSITSNLDELQAALMAR